MARDDAAEDDFPWAQLRDDVPLIYASMGTLQNNKQQVFHTIAESVRDMPVQMVLSRGKAAGELDLTLTSKCDPRATCAAAASA